MRVNLPVNNWTSKADWQKDQYLGQDFSSALVPNLREEFHTFLYGSNTEPPKGFWVIHREMLLDQRSVHWDEENQEVTRGYAWEYKDHLIRCRYMTYPVGRSNETDIIIGSVDNPTYVFFMEYVTNVKKEDMIIELEPGDFLRTPRYDQITMHRSYDIIRVDPVKGDLGRIEYYRPLARNPSPIGNTNLTRVRLT